ncbi:MAG: hypothetical protein LH465_03320, partial [Sphingomonas bacterium]|nr:hypothetical protein [Sphingomonas bacterium]
SGDYSRSYVGDDEWNKYDVPVGSEEHGAKPIELGGIYCLDQGEASAIRLIVGVAAFSALSSNTYRGSYLSLAGQPALHLDACARLARSTPLFVATRRWGYEHFDGECARLIDHARESSTNRPLGVN